MHFEMWLYTFDSLVKFWALKIWFYAKSEPNSRIRKFVSESCIRFSARIFVRKFSQHYVNLYHILWTFAFPNVLNITYIWLDCEIFSVEIMIFMWFLSFTIENEATLATDANEITLYSQMIERKSLNTKWTRPFLHDFHSFVIVTIASNL